MEGNFGFPRFSVSDAARVEMNSNFLIADSAHTRIPWEIAVSNRRGMWDRSLNSERVQILVGGIYMCGFQGQWNSNTTGIRQLQIIHNKPSNLLDDDGTKVISQIRETATVEPGGNVTQQTFTITRFESGEFLTFRCIQTSGGSLALLGAPPSFSGRTAAIVVRLSD